MRQIRRALERIFGLIGICLALSTASLLAAAQGDGLFGRDTLAYLIDRLEKGDGSERAAAAEVIGLMGNSAAAAVPRLIHAAAHTEFGVAAAAVGSLGEIGPAARAAIPTLVAKLGTDTRIPIPAALAGIGEPSTKEPGTAGKSPGPTMDH